VAYTNLNPLFASESGLNVAVVWGGYNDKVVDASSAEDTFSYLSAFCRRLRGLGWRVVVLTMTSATGTGVDTFKNTLNGYIRTRWNGFADMIADVAANANIGADGAYSSSTYFQADGVHLKDAGLTIVAGIVQSALTRIVQVGAVVGIWPFHQDYVMFGHGALDQTAVGNYAFIQQNDGTSFFNAASGKTLNFMINALQQMKITTTGMRFGTGNPVCKLDVDGPVRVKSYTVAALPDATLGTGQCIYVSDETGGAVLAFSDGTNWRRATDRAVVS
jgi:hypothetical protein